jgi:hypothetical protein
MQGREDPMASSPRLGRHTASWRCAWCGGGADDEQSLLDHQEWCLGDAWANTQLLSEVAEQKGELSHEDLVAAARKRRAAGR